MKNIKIYTKALCDVTSISDENEKVVDILNNVYQRFPSEKNTNHHTYAQEKLINFRYVPVGYTVPLGGYVRMIDLKEPYDAKLYSGGFVTTDNGYTTSVRSIRSQTVYTFNRRKYIFFLQLTVDDQLKAACVSL